MGTVQIHGKSGGGGNSLGFEKLWEGDLTGYIDSDVDDVTGGAVDPSLYSVLLVHYEGTASVSGAAYVCYGISRAAISGNWTSDFSINSAGSAKTVDVDVTLLATRKQTTWMIMRNISGGSIVTGSPVRMSVSRESGWYATLDLHFTIYGIKL